MKRTFIPPENRPDIRSAALRSESNSKHYLAVFHHNQRRRQFIQDLLSGRQEIPGLEARYVKEILEGFLSKGEG